MMEAARAAVMEAKSLRLGGLGDAVGGGSWAGYRSFEGI